MADKPITRRDFLKGTVAGAAGLALCGSHAFDAAATPQSVVAVARSAVALNSALEVNRVAAASILGQAIAAAAGAKTPEAAWKKLFKPSDVVGIVTSRAVNPTHMELAEMAMEALKEAGVGEVHLLPQGDIQMVKKCTALIALPALKAHWLTGLGTVLKLYILYSGRARDYHMENSVRLGEIWHLHFLKGKTRLVIVDALRPLCDKGPKPDPRYLWNYNGIIASTDPVAAETVGLKIIQAKRDQIKGEPWPLSPPPLCVEAADKQFHLGTCDLARIQIRKIGWKEGFLI